MSNPFFSFTNRAIPGTKVRADYFNSRMDEVVLAFDGVHVQLGLRAPLNSPALTGTPTAPTASPGTNNTQIATTAFVMAAVSALGNVVNTFNGRSGAVTLSSSDVTTALGFTPYNASNPSGYITASALSPYAPLNSPALTGTPTAPTAAPGTNNTQIATTAFVQSAVGAIGNVVNSFNGRTGTVTLASSDVTSALGFTPYNASNPSGYITSAALSPYAPLNSPAFTGTPTAPTAAQGTNNTQIATTAFVQAAISAISGGVVSFNGRSGAVTLNSGDVTSALGFTPMNSAGGTFSGNVALNASSFGLYEINVSGAATGQRKSRYQHDSDGTVYFGGLNDSGSAFTRGLRVSGAGVLSDIATGGVLWHSANFDPNAKANLSSPNFSGTPTVGGAVIWHANNDGSGSGLDADMVDGLHAGAFALLNSSPVFSGVVRGNNSSNGLGAITVTTTTGTPSGGSDGDIVFVY